jgi:hypothetical protein
MKKRYLKKKVPCSYCDTKYLIKDFAMVVPGWVYPYVGSFRKTYKCFDCAIAQEGENPYNNHVGVDYCPECKKDTVWINSCFDGEECTNCGFNYRGFDDKEEEIFI